MLKISQFYGQTFGDTVGVRSCHEKVRKLHLQEMELPIDSATLEFKLQEVKSINEKARIKMLKLQNDRWQYQQRNDESHVWWIVADVLALAGAAGAFFCMEEEKGTFALRGSFFSG